MSAETKPRKPFRLVGPNMNRILTALDVEGLMRGQVSHATADQLLKAGWKRYSGPALENDGWYVLGTDDRLTPKQTRCD